MYTGTILEMELTNSISLAQQYVVAYIIFLYIHFFGVNGNRHDNPVVTEE